MLGIATIHSPSVIGQLPLLGQRLMARGKLMRNQERVYPVGPAGSFLPLNSRDSGSVGNALGCNGPVAPEPPARFIGALLIVDCPEDIPDRCLNNK
jgi:hypothetical protein